MHKETPLQTQVETMLRDGFPEVEVLLVDRPSPYRVRIFIDRETSPVDTDLLEQVTRQLSPLREQYALEVSSPGIERSLKLPRDFARRVGDNVKVKTTTPIEGRTNITGELVSADDDGIAVAAAGGELRVRYADIASARTVVDWDAELKRSTR